MSLELLLIAVLASTWVLAAAAPVLGRAMGRAGGYPLAAGYAAGTVALGVATPAILRGDPVEVSAPWIPSLGIRVALRLDGLALLFALLILGIGALVMAYSARYHKPGTSQGRAYGFLAAFAASMLGLVLAGDLVLLFVFWELTSITSFFLIGGTGEPGAAKAATRAFLVTSVGGLALLAAFVLLGVAAGGFDLATVLAAPVAEHGAAPAIMALLLVGAFTKSAQIPFHFWLPGAMVAPTPVSTYLHAATMVKAGIYLLARMSPLFAGEAPWVMAVVLTGLATAVYGAAMALKQHDLKALLAYSTVSQLGFIIALVGVGTFVALAAAAVHTVAHAAYKASLFMVVGIIDREAGSRDLRRLSGLRRVMPITATITGLAGLSMAGLPPFLGFVSKEEAFGAFLTVPGVAWLGPPAAVLAVAASIMTFAYGARIFDGAFLGPLRQELYEPPRSFKVPAAVTAVGGLALGLTVWILDPLVARVAGDALAPTTGTVHLELWHGLSPALAMSAITIAGGFVLFLGRRSVDRVLEGVRSPVAGTRSFDALYEGSLSLGRRAGSPFLSSAPAAHVGWVLASAAAAGAAAWAVRGTEPALPAPASMPGDWAVAVLLGAAAAGVIVARNRLAAVALLGVAGFLVAVFYVLLGAPDLAITQLLVETLTVVLVVLVFRRLPTTFRAVSRRRRWSAVGAALAVGSLAGLATFGLTGHRELSEAGAYFLEAASAEAGAQNAVNAILVDFRALDTLGEITVLAAAAIGVYLLAHRVGGGRG